MAPARRPTRKRPRRSAAERPRRAAAARRTAVLSAPTAGIDLGVFDGSRAPIDAGVELLVRIIDGNQRELHSRFHHGPRIAFDVPFHDNLADRYTVIVSADRRRQAGFTPVVVRRGQRRPLDLMLLPKPSRFAFAAWTDLPPSPRLVLEAGADRDAAAARYESLGRERPASLAALLNILTAAAAILLGRGTVLSYLKELVWGTSMAQDRFFAFAGTELLREVQEAVAQGEFAPEVNPGMLHPGATSSFKQLQFGEANLQLTFHERDQRTVGGVPCVKLELDIDYFKDPAAHALLEVVPGLLGGQRTDPATAYVLRWIAGRFAGVPEFDPPFTIVAGNA